MQPSKKCFLITKIKQHDWFAGKFYAVMKKIDFILRTVCGNKTSQTKISDRSIP